MILDEFNVKGVEVYADNAFVSVEMLRWCRTKGINLCGTTRRNYGFPDELKFEGMEPGDWDWRMTDDGLLAVAWKDVGDTKGMSNFHQPRGTTVKRWVRGNSVRVDRAAPTCMADYNRFMGGTDLCDQRRGNYSTQRKSKKWWHALFYFSLDIMMVRLLFIIYNACHNYLCVCVVYSPCMPHVCMHVDQRVERVQLAEWDRRKTQRFYLPGVPRCVA